MANKRRGGGGGGGFKGAITTGLTLLILVSAVFGWANVNNIRSISGGYDYFKSWADKARECGAGEVQWNCETPVAPAPNDGASNSGNNNSGGTTDNQTNTPDKSTDVPEASKNNSKMESFTVLDSIPLKDEEDVPYDRSTWKHWTGSPCDTRETVLFKSGSNVVQDPKSCKALSGSWVDVYSGDTFTNASDLDIDHVIPLGYAAKHGGQNWSAEKKEQFANDASHLLAVSAKENRSKSDSGPEEYMPKNKAFHCDYSKLWVSSAAKYGVSITEGDRLALKAGLQKCSN